MFLVRALVGLALRLGAQLGSAREAETEIEIEIETVTGIGIVIVIGTGIGIEIVIVTVIGKRSETAELHGMRRSLDERAAHAAEVVDGIGAETGIVPRPEVEAAVPM